MGINKNNKKQTGTKKSSVEVSSSVVQECRKSMERESRTSSVEVTSSSRETVLDSKGNVIKVIEGPSTSQSHDEQHKNVLSRSLQGHPRSTVVTTLGPVTKKSFMSSETSEVTSQGQIKDGQTVFSTTKVQTSSQLVDDNGNIQKSQTKNVDGETKVIPKSSSVTSTDVTDFADKKVTKLGDSAWNGKFVYEKPASVVRTSESRNDSVEVEDVSEAQNMVSMCSSYIVEYGSTSDLKNTGRVSTLSETIIEEESSRSTPGSEDKKLTKQISNRSLKSNLDIHEVTDDNIINEADLISSSYLVEHSVTTNPRSTSPEKKEVRFAKPGASSWDGTFISEKKKDDKKDDRLVITSESTSFDSSFVLDKRAESAESATAVEVVVVKDGKPVEVTTTFKSRPEKSPDKILDEKRRPGKMGDSAWDGSFVYEKQQTKRNDVDLNQKSPRDKSPTKNEKRVGSTGKSGDVTSKTTSTTWDGSFTYEIPRSEYQKIVEETKMNTDFSSDFSTEESMISISKMDARDKVEETDKTSKISILKIDQKPDGPNVPRHSSDLKTESVKLGSSTWDGTFVTEKKKDVKPERNGVKPETESSKSTYMVEKTFQLDSLDSKTPDSKLPDRKFPRFSRPTKSPERNGAKPTDDSNKKENGPVTKLTGKKVNDFYDVNVTSEVVESYAVQQSSSFTSFDKVYETEINNLKEIRRTGGVSSGKLRPRKDVK